MDRVLCIFLCFLMLTCPSIGQVISVHVKGLVCPSCAIGIKKHLAKTKKITTVKIDVNKQLTYIHVIKNTNLTDGEIIKAITNAGYETIKIIRNPKNL